MIFNDLDKAALEKINGDNCFAYACKMGGIPEHKLRMMRELIRVESFPKSKIQKICAEVNIRVFVKDAKRNEMFNYGPDGNARYGPDEKDCETVNMILMEDHYMLNEGFTISPFYIKNRAEIESSKSVRFWTKEEKQHITKRNVKKCGTYWERENRTFKIKHVIEAIFAVEGFKPIVQGDRMSAGILMSESEKRKRLFPITSLEYDEKYCCRLKQKDTWKAKVIRGK
jgi:hypothetical protein